jgi:hypothetical protein
MTKIRLNKTSLINQLKLAKSLSGDIIGVVMPRNESPGPISFVECVYPTNGKCPDGCLLNGLAEDIYRARLNATFRARNLPEPHQVLTDTSFAELNAQANELATSRFNLR